MVFAPRMPWLPPPALGSLRACFEIAPASSNFQCRMAWRSAPTASPGAWTVQEAVIDTAPQTTLSPGGPWVAYTIRLREEP